MWYRQCRFVRKNMESAMSKPTNIIEECLKKPQPIVLVEKADLARTLDFIYKDVDGYTESYALEETIESLIVYCEKPGFLLVSKMYAIGTNAAIRPTGLFDPAVRPAMD
ncbi:hypothetical protein EJB05_09886, partial [Eragrostis curvula]